ncbi:MAG: hypothetical protein WC907_02260 [Acholeplasmataceae bacterium]
MYPETTIIPILILLILIVSTAYILYFKYRAQKAIDNPNIKRINLPAPLNFILSVLLVGIFLASGVGIYNLVSTNNNKNNPTSEGDHHQTDDYHILSSGELASEFNYIKSEVIEGKRTEYELVINESNDFTLYYAKLKEPITNNFLPKYIIYITYHGNLILEENYHIKISLTNDLTKSSMIGQYKTDYVTLLLTSIDVSNLKINAEIKHLEIQHSESTEGDNSKPENIDEMFNDSPVVLSYDFNLNNLG